MILPSVVRSGRTPLTDWAPPGATRNAMTSSKISTAPVRSQIARRPESIAGDAARTPPAPWTGLDDDRGEVAIATADRALDTVEVLPWQRDDELADGRRDAGGRGHRRVLRSVIGTVEDTDHG